MSKLAAVNDDQLVEPKSIVPSSTTVVERPLSPEESAVVTSYTVPVDPETAT
jgi:hypothetical protein